MQVSHPLVGVLGLVQELGLELELEVLESAPSPVSEFAAAVVAAAVSARPQIPHVAF